MGLKGAHDRRDQPADVESEREALRRQRHEAAAELEKLKRALSERVAQVQLRERELAGALARVEKREQKLHATGDRGTRLDAVRLRLAEAKDGRTALDARRAELDARERELEARERVLDARERESVDQSQAPVAPVAAVPDETRAKGLDEREAELTAHANALAERESALAAREKEISERSAELEERERALALEKESVEQPQAPPAAPDPAELERIEAKLTELREAEKAFARTQHELAARSDALAEQEVALAERERALSLKEAPATPGIAELDARLRRLEQGAPASGPEPQTFSAGLRALQERGLRGGRPDDQPLH